MPGPPLPLFHGVRRRQRHARQNARGAGELMETHPDVGLIKPCRRWSTPNIVWTHPAICQPPLRAAVHCRIELLAATIWEIIGGTTPSSAPNRSCNFDDLPQLPGRKPFGGQILSHDFVRGRAAVARKLGNLVRLRTRRQLRGNAPAMIENAQRERRWCQGNLQHGLVLFAKDCAG